MNKRVVTFGEIMLRLTPPGYQRLIQARSLEMTYGGAEANVAVALARFGLDVSYVTRLPQNPLGDAVIEELRRYGVDTSYIVRGGERLGTYYLERGAGVRGSEVLYDRTGSAIASAGAKDFDWESIFYGADWFHFTGITPALSEEVLGATTEACKTAKELGVTISCDINFRSKLWDPEAAGKKLGELLQYVDICIVNEEHAAMLFGIQAPGKEIHRDAFSREGSLYVSSELMDKYKLRKVAITYRRTIAANENRWWATLYDGTDIYLSREYHLDIVDRVGSGDAFSGGLIYALLEDEDCQFAVEFGAASCALKHTVEGDFSQAYREEIIELMGGHTKGAVNR